MNDNEYIKAEPTDYITTNLPNWDDEEVLRQFYKFFPRVSLIGELIENDEGFVVGQVLVTMAGNKLIFSEPELLDWPLMKVPAPEVPVDGTA